MQNEKFRDLVMVTKLSSGEVFASVMIPVTDHMFIAGFPMNVSESGIGTPWFNMTANRVFNFSVNDIMFCKSPKDSIVTEYLEKILMKYSDAYSFLEHCVEEANTAKADESQATATESIVYH